MAANLVSFLTGKKKKHKEGNLGRQVFGLASCTVWTLVFTLVTVLGTVHAPRYCSLVGKALLTACYCSEGLWSSFLNRVFYYSRAIAQEIVRVSTVCLAAQGISRICEVGYIESASLKEKSKRYGGNIFG